MIAILIGFIVMFVGFALSILIAKSLRRIGAALFVSILMAIAGWAVMFSPHEFALRQTEIPVGDE